MQLPTPLDCISRTRARAAEIGAGDERDAFLLGGQGNRMDLGVGERAVDENAVPGVGHVGDLGNAMAAQQVVEIMLPARAHLGIDRCVHC